MFVHSWREEQRFDARVSLDIILNKYIKGRPYLCRATNISRKGLLVHRVHEPHSPETSVGLQFQLPGSERVITCAGQVVFEHRWLSASGIWITSIEPEHQQLIDAYVLGQLGAAALH
jgi:hypothetical protein